MWCDAYEGEQPQIHKQDPALPIQPRGLPPARLPILLPSSMPSLCGCPGREMEDAAARDARERRGLHVPLPETPAHAGPTGVQGQSCILREEAPAPHQDSEL